MTEQPLVSRNPGQRSAAKWTLLTAIAPAVWGSTYIVTSQLLPQGHPLFASAVRALPAGLIALIIARSLPHGVWVARVMILGVLNIGLFFPLLFVTAERLPGGVAATLGATGPLMVILMARWLLETPVKARSLGWAVLGACGVALVVLGPSAGLDPVGVISGLGAAASMSLGVTLTKKWGRPPDMSSLGLAGWQLTTGGALVSTLTLVFEPLPTSFTTGAIVGYAWLLIAGGVVTYTLWMEGISRLPVSNVALLGLISPLVAALLGAVVAGQVFAAAQLLGFFVAMVALVAGQLPTRRGTVTQLARQEN